MRIDSSTTAIFGTMPVMKTTKSETAKHLNRSGDLQSPFNVQLSSMVEKLSGVQPSNGEIRTEKVQNISRQLASGQYSISGQNVAAKMLLALQG